MESTENSAELKKGDTGSVIYIYIVISYSIIVTFCWGIISGEGVVDPSDVCHGDPVHSDEIRLLLTKLNPEADSYHPTSRSPMEKESWAVIPKSKYL